MKHTFLYPIIFLVTIAVPLLLFMSIGNPDSKPTFVAISGVSSFLFGLLATYTLTSRHSRLEKIVQNASIERGELVFIYECLQVFPIGSQAKVMKKIDEYLMAELDLDVTYFYQTDTQFNDLSDEIIALPIKSDKQKKIYDRLLMAIERIEQTRKYSATLFVDRIVLAEWIILYFLITLIYISLLFSNTGGLFPTVIIIGLACIIAYILVVAVKLDRMKWKIDDKIFEPYEQTMETLGLLRYYPETILRSGKIKRLKNRPKGTQYRVGTTPNYPDISKRTVELRTL